MRAAQLCHIRRISDHRDVGGNTLICLDILSQLIQDRPFPDPAVQKKKLLRPIPVEQIFHGIVINTPALYDGNSIMGNLQLIFLPDIVLHQNPDRDPCPRKGYDHDILSLCPHDPVRQFSHRQSRRSGILFKRFFIDLHIFLRRHILDRKHLTVVFSRLDQPLALLCGLRLHQARNILEQ